MHVFRPHDFFLVFDYWGCKSNLCGADLEGGGASNLTGADRGRMWIGANVDWGGAR